MSLLSTSSAAETVALGAEIGKGLSSGSIVCLFGDLGAGKTTLIKGIAEGVCKVSDIPVNSPTFVYLNIYPGKNTLYHFDLYRLKDVEEFLSMGFEEYLYTDGVVCLEWSERIASILPKECIEIHLHSINEQSRSIEVRKNS